MIKHIFSISWILILAACSVVQPPAASPSKPAATPVTRTLAATAPVLLSPIVPPTPTPPWAAYRQTAEALPIPTSPGRLRELAEERGLLIGAAVDYKSLYDDPSYAGLLVSEFNALAVENALKFGLIHPEPNRYDFRAADEIIGFAEAHRLAVHGHVLVWDFQLPDWILNAHYSKDEWKAVLREHILTVVGRYRGQVSAWDVVNEALDEEGLLRDTIWLRSIGPEYISLAFRWAHEADPEARLYYNDHLSEGLNAKSNAVYALAQGLLAQGYPIDGIGLQMHVWLDGPPEPAELAANMHRLDELGLEVYITEMDVRTQYSQAPPPEKLALQSEVFGHALEVCLEAPNCTDFLVWGLTDRHSWIPDYTGTPDFPLLFDAEYHPKPAYDALIRVLQAP